jgi:hypothetical protein
MSFTGLDYDVGAYRQSLRASTGPGFYRNTTPLPMADERVGAGHTDVESELFNLPRKLSDDPRDQYVPGRFNTPVPTHAKTEERYGRLFPDDTRLTNPAWTLRGTGVNRFGHPLEQPQDHALEPFQWPDSDTRNAKDNHRPLVRPPMAVDPSLPPPPPSHDMPEQEFYFGDLPPLLPQVVPQQPPKEFRYIL